METKWFRRQQRSLNKTSMTNIKQKSHLQEIFYLDVFQGHRLEVLLKGLSQSTHAPKEEGVWVSQKRALHTF